MNPNNSTKRQACTSCWAGHHECSGIGNNQCKRCRGTPFDMNAPNPFPLEAVDAQFRAFNIPGPSFKEEAQQIKSMTLDVDIHTSKGSKFQLETIQLDGQLSPPTPALIKSLDPAIEHHFSPKLILRVGNSALLGPVSCCIGYLHVLGSTETVHEMVRTKMKHAPPSNESPEYYLGIQFRYCFICRAVDLIQSVMNNVWFGDPSHRFQSITQADLVALSALQLGIVGYRDTRRSTQFPGAAPQGELASWLIGLNKTFYDWLGHIVDKLKQIQHGTCGRYLSWSNIIEGRLKSLEAARRRDETLTINLYLVRKVSFPYDLMRMSAQDNHSYKTGTWGHIARSPVSMARNMNPPLRHDVESYYKGSFRHPSVSTILPDFPAPTGCSSTIAPSVQQTYNQAMAPQSPLVTDYSLAITPRVYQRLVPSQQHVPDSQSHSSVPSTNLWNDSASAQSLYGQPSLDNEYVDIFKYLNSDFNVPFPQNDPSNHQIEIFPDP
ncbi:hypothetical protein B0O99DRAFT_618203 [Bisporella sp. PMI_857]|nr:hypothetical protein B0O99DRAFT_618203 [Bisporella sp. PMI_857]